MNSSPNATGGLLPEHSALQHERAPAPAARCFSNWYGEVSRTRSEARARRACRACARMQQAPRARAAAAEAGNRARSRRNACAIMAASGPPAVLVPSLINPPRILDLDEEVSLTRGDRGMGRRALLLDWGKAERALRAVSRRACRAIAAAFAAQHRRAGRADRLLPRRDDGDRRRQSGARSSASRRSPRRGISPAIRTRSKRALAGHVAPFGAAAASARRAADGGAAGAPSGRSTRNAPCASSPSSDGSTQRAPRRGASSSSRNGPTKASPCPIPQRRSWSRTCSAATCPGSGRWMVGGGVAEPADGSDSASDRRTRPDRAAANGRRRATSSPSLRAMSG